MSIVWLNERLVPEEQAHLSPRDAGLLHAAGVFTTMRAYSGRVFRLAEHLARLRGSCAALSIPATLSDEMIRDAVDDLLDANGLSDARLRLTVTRGAIVDDRLNPTILLTAQAFEPYPAEFYERGMTVVVLDDQKLNPFDVQAGHKTLNYFSRLAALRSATERGAGEAIWFDVNNRLQSGSISNVFIVKEGKLRTPPTAADLRGGRSAVLPGVTRQAVVELAIQQKVDLAATPLTIDDLLGADEVFLTNSVMGLMPVCRIERKAIGNDRPGPVFRKLSEAYEEHVRTSLM
jgi:branched-chain amino acid aminotransferase